MMTLPPGQFVITDSGVATPVTSGQVKAVTPVSLPGLCYNVVIVALPLSLPFEVLGIEPRATSTRHAG